MTDHKRADLVTKENLMKLLSDTEVANVSNTEKALGLNNGDEFIDLEHIKKGIQFASAKTKTPPGQVLSKKSVHAKTWTKILKELKVASSESADAGL